MKKKNISSLVTVIIVLVGAAYLVYQQIGQESGRTFKPGSVLSVPGESSTQEERGQYFNRVAADAVETNNVDISSCLPNPMTASVKMGDELTFVNNDEMEHKLFFTPDHIFTVEAGSSLSIKAEFGEAAGIFPFECDSSRSPVGVIMVNK